MYKTIVVDDETIIRQGIVKAIQWEALGLELAGEAEDGQSAVDLAVSVAPDIVIMDMRMPGMDGIGLIHALKARFPEIMLIIISAYADFVYTREAIINKAFDYLLKPVKKDELNQILTDCVSRLDARGSSEKDSRQAGDRLAAESTVLRLLQQNRDAGPLSAEDQALVAGVLCFPGATCCVCKLDHFRAAEAASRGEDFLMDLRSAAADVFATITERAVVLTNRQDHEIILSVNWSSPAGLPSPARLKEAVRLIGVRTGMSVSLGIGEPSGAPMNLLTSYKHAKRVITLKRVSETGVVLFSESSPRAGLAEKMLPQDDQLLLSALKSGDEERALGQFNLLLDEMVTADCSIHAIQKHLVMLLGDLDKMLDASGTSLDVESGSSSLQYINEIVCAFSPEEFKAIFRSIISKTALFYKMKAAKGGRKIVEEIVRSIRAEYRKPLTLYNFAKQYYLNPDYLGRVIKSETGKGFADLLMEIRIEKARELIQKNTCARLYEVAEAVGYEDYSHFCKVFKHVTGLSPGDFAEKGLLAVE